MATESSGTLPWIERIAESFPHIPFDHFHQTTAPHLIKLRGSLVARDLVGAEPLAFVADTGISYTWSTCTSGLNALPVVSSGINEATTVVRLSEHAFSDIMNELLTPSGAVQTGRAVVSTGELSGWQRWEPAFQSLLTGREIYSNDVRKTLIDRSGQPLDLTKQFTVDDDLDDLRHFFATAGYLHIKNVFSDEEVTLYSNAIEEARRQTHPADGFSWWSVNRDGQEMVTRINHLERFSSIFDELACDPRLARFACLVDKDLLPCRDRLDGPMVFIKNPWVVKRNGDLRWHTDDGSGGHSVMCPLVQAGVQLDHANAENGQILVLAASHRYTKHWIHWGGEGDFPVVPINTEPGDLTLHYGDTMHTTPPPTSPEAGRRALYIKFAEPKTFDWIPSGCHYNDVQFRPDADGRLASRARTWDSQPKH